MRGRVLHRASPDLNICCANISWVRFSKMCRARHISPPNIGKNEKTRRWWSARAQASKVT